MLQRIIDYAVSYYIKIGGTVYAIFVKAHLWYYITYIYVIT
jgi:hypothetical protein